MTTTLDIRYIIHVTSRASPTSLSEEENPNPDRSLFDSGTLNLEVKRGRMIIPQLIKDHLQSLPLSQPGLNRETGEEEEDKEPGSYSNRRDKLSIIACGPRELVFECENSIGVLSRMADELGWSGLDFHGEMYSM